MPHQSETRRQEISREELSRWFAVSGYQNLVLRVVDLLEISQRYRDLLYRIMVADLGMPPRWDGEDFKSWFGRLYPGGYVVLSVQAIVANVPEGTLGELQQLVNAYRDYRQLHKGEPNRTESCICQGRKPMCKRCGGEGVIVTFLDMSDKEQELARG